MNDLGPTEEEACKSDEGEEELMEDNVASTSDDTEDRTAEISKELEDTGSASEPKDVDATVVPKEGNNSKASKKVSFEYLLLFTDCTLWLMLSHVSVVIWWCFSNCKFRCMEGFNLAT